MQVNYPGVLSPAPAFPVQSAAAEDQRCTFDYSSDDLQIALRVGLESLGDVSLPDWEQCFGGFASPHESLRQQITEQIRQFVISDHYYELRERFQTAISCLEGWSDSLDPRLIHAVDLQGIKQAWMQFGDDYLPPVTDDDFLNRLDLTHKEIYQRTCLDWERLGRIASDLTNGRRRSDSSGREWCDAGDSALLQTLAQLVTPGGALTVCEPGMVTHMADEVRSLCHRLCPPSLADRLERLCRSLFEDCIVRHAIGQLAELHRHPGSEVHVVNAWQNFMGQLYGLPAAPLDPYALDQMLGSHALQADIKFRLDGLFRPSRLVWALAAEMQECFQAHFSEPLETLPYERVQEAHRLHESTWGPVPLSALVRVSDAGTLEFESRNDLRFLHLVRQLERDSRIPAVLRTGFQAIPAAATVCGRVSTPAAQGAVGDASGSMSDGAHGLRVQPVIRVLNDNPVSRPYPQLIAWVETPRAGTSASVEPERRFVGLDDISPSLLLSSIRSLQDPQGRRDARAAVSALIAAWRHADSDAIGRFMEDADVQRLGIKQMPVFSDPARVHCERSIIHCIRSDSPLSRYMETIFNSPWRRLKDVARATEWGVALTQGNIGALESQIRRGWPDPRQSMCHQVRNGLEDRDSLIALEKWLQGQGLAWRDIDRPFGAVLLDRRLWPQSDATRIRLLGAAFEGGRLDPNMAIHEVPDAAVPPVPFWRMCMRTGWLPDDLVIRLMQLPGVRQETHALGTNLCSLALAIEAGRVQVVNHLLSLNTEAGQPLYPPDAPLTRKRDATGGGFGLSAVKLAIMFRQPAILQLLLAKGWRLHDGSFQGPQEDWCLNLSRVAIVRELRSPEELSRLREILALLAHVPVQGQRQGDDNPQVRMFQ